MKNVRSPGQLPFVTTKHKMAQLKKILWLLVTLAATSYGCKPAPDTQSSAAIDQIKLKQAERYLQSGQIQVAQDQARSILIENPESIAAKKILIESALVTGDDQTASEVLSSLSSEITTDRDVTSLTIRTRLLRGESQRVLKLLDETAPLWSGQTGERIRYHAMALNNGGRFEEANELLATSTEATNAILYEKIKLALLFENASEADALLKTAHEQPGSPSPDWLILSAERHIMKEEWKDAEEALTTALSTLPNTDSTTLLKAAIFRSLSDVLVQTNRLSEVVVYDRLLSSAIPDREANNRKLKHALQLIDEQKEEEAVGILDELILETPKPKSAQRLICQFYFQQMRINKAAGHCSKT